jgi:hypothetical protein
MSNTNSALTYSKNSLDNLQEALGIAKFSTTDERLWSLVFNGFIIQGGFTVAGVNQFHAPFPLQVLGVFINGGVATGISTTQFTSAVLGHWWAIGV